MLVTFGELKCLKRLYFWLVSSNSLDSSDDFATIWLDSECALFRYPRNQCSWIIEPHHDKTNKMTVRPSKTQISLGIRPVWSESSLSAWRKLGSLATQWAHSEDSDQIGRMPRLIWAFAGCTVTLLVLSCRGSLLHESWLTMQGRKISPWPCGWNFNQELDSLVPGCNSNHEDKRTGQRLISSPISSAHFAEM